VLDEGQAPWAPCSVKGRRLGTRAQLRTGALGPVLSAGQAPWTPCSVKGRRLELTPL
jgi:hypothetical protein